MLFAGVAASALAAPVLEQYQDYFPMIGLTVEETNLIRADPDDPVAWAIERANRTEWLFRNAALQMGLYGVILGAFLGLSEGLLVRSIWKAPLFSVALAACGAVGGILAALSAASLGTKMGDDITADPTQLTLAMHAAVFAIIGLALGLGSAILTRKSSVIVRGAGGGLVAGLLFLPLAMFLVPTERTNLPVPEGLTSKFLFLILAGGLIGLCIGRTPRRAQRPHDVAADPTAEADTSGEPTNS